jgi:hypothetical protein
MSMTPNKTIRVPAADLPVVAEADVVVVGGGTAGFIAAVAAARNGASVALVEQNGFLGGALTGTYVSTPGYFADSDGRQVIGGIAWEVIERLERAGQALVRREKFKAQIFPEAVKTVALEMTAEAGVRVFLYTMLAEALVEDGRLTGVVVQNKSGRSALTGRVFIDASGDADLAARAGAPFELLPPAGLWQTSVDLTVAGIDARRVVAWAQEHIGEVLCPEMDYSHREDVPIQPMFTLVIPHADTRLIERGILHTGPMPTVKLMIQRSIGRVQGSVEIDPTDAAQIAWAEGEGRRRALAHLEYLRANVPGFENAIVVGESFLGVRESRRIVGDYRLTIQDLLENRRFPDVVLRNARALDRHLAGERFELVFVRGSHDIPYRALLPQGLQNVLVAGRCLSCDHEAHASLRGAAVCMGMGHAAGTAAALAAGADGGTRQVDIPRLQERLRAEGMILQGESLA